jgi:hypothetical protein
MVFVDGEKFELEVGGRAVGQAGATAPAAPTAALGGAWTITSNSPQGSIESTLAIQQQGNAFTGSMTSQMMGTTPVTDGMIAGKKVTWSVTVTFGGQGITISYAGEVEGTKMTGTVTAGTFGSFPFSGEKRP